MNEVIAGIYGTGGHEKVASEGGDKIETLSDLALALVCEDGDAEKLASVEGGLEKIAAAHDAVLDDLVSFDRAGRAMAHQEISEMEKEAFEKGDPSALEAFFSDAPVAPSANADLKEKLAAELKRRLGK